MNRLAFRNIGLPLSVLLVLAATGCEVRTTTPGRDGGGPPLADGEVQTGCVAGAPGLRCFGTEAVDCREDGSEGARLDCATSGTMCVDGLGCRVCTPGQTQCSGNDVQTCKSDGTGWEVSATCDPAAGQMCNASRGLCTSACDEAAASNSYIGCEYWPTPTANVVAEEFDFAVVVANPQSVPANVTVSRNGSTVTTASVPAGGLETIRLPWNAELKTPFSSTGVPTSSLVRGGAYRLQSTMPVTVYQFNPLEYRIAKDCIDSFGDCDMSSYDPLFGFPICDNVCFSHTNDASLLLPTHVLTGNYIAVSERTRAHQCGSTISSTPGFVTIVGASSTPVEVVVTLNGHVAASADGAVADGTAGTTQSYTLNEGDVLQLATKAVTSCVPGGTTAGQCGGGIAMTHCQVPDEYDLTGTEIRASGPVMVLGGHTCAFMPFNRFACDHMEEAVFPLESWGSDFVVSRAQPLRGEPNVVRVISGDDNNEITFDPASVHASVTLNRGQVIEFEVREDFRVKGTAAMLVAQFLVGQNYDGSVEEEGAGDPAMSLAIPNEQFRTEYTFLAPETFEQSYVNVVAPNGAEVMLSSNGGAPVSVTGWNSVGASDLRATRVSIPGGAHQISSTVPFGIVVYGYGSYTSYMYPGGLDFEEINVPF